jgi:hypothetical protein
MRGRAGTERRECSARPRHAGCDATRSLRDDAKARRDESPTLEHAPVTVPSPIVNVQMNSQVAGRKGARVACPSRRDESSSPRRLPRRTMPRPSRGVPAVRIAGSSRRISRSSRASGLARTARSPSRARPRPTWPDPSHLGPNSTHSLIALFAHQGSRFVAGDSYDGSSAHPSWTARMSVRACPSLGDRTPSLHQARNMPRGELP